ncbi:protein translocase subunit SecD [Vibrio sp. V27_P1S3P104]|uniref:protein translocase subunit SecD n=3 Tax=Vibrio TaxID=662 RepID=UPI001373541D|nr:MULTISPECIES: protein translocase subunit SecD [unclassified Vibrio]NAW69228.1 protein translocase subunit SecD [Vibrio sp. V28_P6S34P95]NAX06311.1 protein translocase subunit SecD [Vibrio sp. V30_P3S12P165]NAX35390.1 protein translocase subunit SecD [Vibrio sp. V29_P1S30P107]NAX38686.1 protein translocase subunit SecD [Vibrio sp. V27_P1S3P104]NAX41463.1 protein translocase subunit SecD [Vibrio sp. V26_P1S5P106]
MQKKSSKASARLINHYSMWKYLILVVTVAILILSAIPTWYGEQPSIQIQYSSANQQLNNIVNLNRILKEKGLQAQEIRQQENTLTLVFSNETEQAQARQVLDPMIKEGESITFSYVSMAPRWLSELGFHPIKLGLDLRGGVQFLLNVDVDKAFQEQRDALTDELRDMLRNESIRGASIQPVGNDGFMVSVNSNASLSKIQKFVKENYAGWEVKVASNRVTVQPSQQNKLDFQSATLQQNLKIMRDRIEELGITEALVQRQGEHSIRIELPGVQDPSQAKNVIGATASLAFYEVKTIASREDIILNDNAGHAVILNKRPVLTGDHIINARAGMDKMGFSEVNISLDHTGGKVMSDFSAKHIGKPMATVYREYKTNARGETERSERVISVATIQSQLGSQFRITGAGSNQEAQQLALLLRAGSLTAPVTIVEERTIGASLGAENIANGFAALALGMAMTLTFMALWYRRLGWIANVALITNMGCLLGLIALLPGAVLTLPGIAGLVLTVGMAVDTNVLIFERIRDKLTEGRSFAQAIDSGFSSALSTILDANITTMITAVVLYCIGNGPIQGFALTLGLGLLTSMFTGVFASRALINLVWGRDTRRDVRV